MVIRRASALTLRGQLGIFVKATLGPRGGEIFAFEADGKSPGRFSIPALDGLAVELFAKDLRQRFQQLGARQHKPAIAVRRWQPAEVARSTANHRSLVGLEVEAIFTQAPSNKR